MPLLGNLVTRLLGLTAYFQVPQLPLEPSRPDPVLFVITATQDYLDPVGLGPRVGILVNNTFPGPTLHLKVGQDVRFLIHNHVWEETSLHFHGISQQLTPWSDGVPGVTETSIRPGTSKRYEWTAEEPGVYFYHSHRKGQIQDGFYGAIVVGADESWERPFYLISENPAEIEAMKAAEKNLQPLMISDWSQFRYDEIIQMQSGADIDWNCFDAIVVNGAGSQYCLEREVLDDFTSPYLRRTLTGAGFPEGLTPKGCIPPIRLFQGDFSLNKSALPLEAYDICAGGVGEGGNYTVHVRSADSWAALTFINPGGLYPLKVNVDDHDMWVYAVDGHYIRPVLVDQVTVANGARISVLIQLDRPRGRYMMRIATALYGQVLGGFANFDYDSVADPEPGSSPSTDYGGRPLKKLRRWRDECAKPFPAVRPASHASKTFKLRLEKLGRPKEAWEWTLSGQSGYNMSEEDRAPPLLFRKPSGIPDGDLFLKTNKDDWIDIIIQVHGAHDNHPRSMQHTMHKHGNRFFVIGSGVGPFRWANVDEAAEALPDRTFNLEDPPLRDSFYTPSVEKEDTWIVIRYEATQSGAWLFHCHIQTHLSGGMAVVLLDGVNEWPDLPYNKTLG